MAATSSPLPLRARALPGMRSRLMNPSLAWTRVTVPAVVAVAVLLAIAWAFLVPIFESPDEDWHADYAFSIFSAGHPLTVRDRPVDNGPESRTHPWTAYLAARSGFDNIPFHPWIKAPADYGSPDYYRRLAAEAPPDRPQANNPHLVQVYPFGYYALVAVWIGFLHLFTGNLVTLFFGARLLSVLLLACSLVLTYGICREMRIGAGQALGLTALVGLFPLTPFVASYIQPENLSLTLVSLCIFLGLRLRRRPQSLALLALLGLTAGALLVTKQQFWICAFLPVLAMLMLDRGRRLLRVLLLVIPSLVTQSIQTWIGYGGHALDYTQPLRRQVNYADIAAAAGHGPLALAQYTLTTSFEALVDFFLLGKANLSFWGMFGWLDTPLTFGPSLVTSSVRGLIALGTIAVLTLTLWRLSDVSRRVLRAWRRGHRRWALRVALSNPFLNGYFLFTAFMLGLYVLTTDSFGSQGRNWFPFLLPAFIAATEYAPRALRNQRARTWTARAIAGGLGAYTLLSIPAGLLDVHARYYGNNREVTPVAVASLKPGPVDSRYKVDYVVESRRGALPGSTLAVGGWSTGAGALFLAVDDGPFQRAVTGDDSPEAAQRFGSDYSRSGFDAILATDGLAPGEHRIRLLIVGRDLATYEVVETAYRFRLVAEPS